jgi:hypothetical protein
MSLLAIVGCPAIMGMGRSIVIYGKMAPAQHLSPLLASIRR